MGVRFIFCFMEEEPFHFGLRGRLNYEEWFLVSGPKLDYCHKHSHQLCIRRGAHTHTHPPTETKDCQQILKSLLPWVQPHRMANSTNLLRFSSISLAVQLWFGQLGRDGAAKDTPQPQQHWSNSIYCKCAKGFVSGREIEPQRSCTRTVVLFSLTWHIRMSKMSHKNQSDRRLGSTGVQKGGSNVPGTQTSGAAKKKREKQFTK